MRPNATLAELTTRIFRFGITSGVGLAIDVGIFIALTASQLPSGLANFISATCGVTFVYFASVRRIFSYRGEKLFVLFVAYLAYQAAAVTGASWAVAILAEIMLPILAKLLILPVTFSANFIFMHFLTRQRQRAVVRLEGTGTGG